MSTRPRQTRAAFMVSIAALGILTMSPGASAQETAWTDQFGTSDFDAIYALDAAQGDVYGVGELDDAPGFCDVVVRAYHGNGTVKWTELIGTPGCDFAEGVAAGGGAVYVGGGTSGTLPGQSNGGSFDAFVRKYTEDGDEVWTHQFGSTGNDFVRAAVATEDAVFVVGSVRSALPGQALAGAADAFVRKYDAAGNEEWTRQFGTAGIDAVREVDLVPGGGVVVVGETGGALPGQQASGGSDVFVRRYDANGKERWTRQFGTSGDEIAWGVDFERGAVYVAGDVAGALPEEMYAGGPLDAFVRRYDGNGNEVWTQQFGTTGFDRAIRIAADGDRVVVVGRVGGALPEQDFAGGATDPFVRLYDADGNEDWTVQFGGTMEPEAATGVIFDGPGGDIFVSGGIGGTLPGQESQGYIDAFVMKILLD